MMLREARYDSVARSLHAEAQPDRSTRERQAPTCVRPIGSHIAI